MPSKQQHQHQADVNIELSQVMEDSTLDILGCPPYGWVVTTLFYAALHLIESRFAKEDTHLRTHHTRNRAIEADNVLSEIRDEYNFLHDLSRSARYDCENVEHKDVEHCRDVLDCIASYVSALGSDNP